jgi:hypothetical protein
MIRCKRVDIFDSAAEIYGGIDKIVGSIVNRCPQSDNAGNAGANDLQQSRLFRRGNFHLVGAIPHKEALTFCRSIDGGPRFSFVCGGLADSGDFICFFANNAMYVTVL